MGAPSSASLGPPSVRAAAGGGVAVVAAGGDGLAGGGAGAGAGADGVVGGGCAGFCVLGRGNGCGVCAETATLNPSAISHAIRFTIPIMTLLQWLRFA